VKVTGVKPLVEAVREFDPATVPSVQPPTVATPDAFVVAELPVIVPPPLVTANETGTPAIAAPRWSFTITEGSSLTAAPPTAVREVLEFAVTLVATGGATDVSPPPHAPRTRASDTTVTRAVLEKNPVIGLGAWGGCFERVKRQRESDCIIAREGVTASQMI
jgi:hypothetical protein